MRPQIRLLVAPRRRPGDRSQTGRSPAPELERQRALERPFCRVLAVSIAVPSGAKARRRRPVRHAPAASRRGETEVGRATAERRVPLMAGLVEALARVVSTGASSPRGRVARRRARQTMSPHEGHVGIWWAVRRDRSVLGIAEGTRFRQQSDRHGPEHRCRWGPLEDRSRTRAGPGARCRAPELTVQHGAPPAPRTGWSVTSAGARARARDRPCSHRKEITAEDELREYRGRGCLQPPTSSASRNRPSRIARWHRWCVKC